MLATASLPASTVEQVRLSPFQSHLPVDSFVGLAAAVNVSLTDPLAQIVHLAAQNKVTLARNDIFRILALVAFAQSQPDADLSLQAVNDALPLPNPHVEVPSSSAAAPNQAAPEPAPVRPPPPQQLPSTFSPWDTAPRYAVPGSDANGVPVSGAPFTGGNPEAEAERGFWRRLETVEVTLIPEKESWFLRKYRVTSNRRVEALSRRYSDFVWLHHTLVARYVRNLNPPCLVTVLISPSPSASFPLCLPRDSIVS